MTVWRITHARHLESAFSGAGAEKWGGRFNAPGRRVIYTAGSISLAMLEMLVQANTRSRLVDHFCVSATFDDAFVEQLDAEALPAGWDARPYGKAPQEVGDRWLDEERSLVLGVPSIANPYERNYLINPSHARFPKVEIGKPFRAPFDPRLAG